MFTEVQNRQDGREAHKTKNGNFSMDCNIFLGEVVALNAARRDAPFINFNWIPYPL